MLDIGNSDSEEEVTCVYDSKVCGLASSTKRDVKIEPGDASDVTPASDATSDVTPSGTVIADTLNLLKKNYPGVSCVFGKVE